MTQIPRRIPRRTFLAGTFGAGLGLSLAACGKDDPAAGGTDGGKATTVSVGYIADFNGASMVAVAEDRNLWAKHGLKPSLKVPTARCRSGAQRR
jgi:NitT/TauT family transport system substrate-binding protein